MFNNYKEIVTKTIIGKGKKVFKNDYEITVDKDINNVLGCWVINHNLRGKKDEDYIKINGSYDINIWYSYDNNTKTDVVSKKMFYEEKVKVKVRENTELNDESEIIIRSLKNPTCVDVSNEDKTIKYTIIARKIIENILIFCKIAKKLFKFSVIIFDFSYQAFFVTLNQIFCRFGFLVFGL